MTILNDFESWEDVLSQYAAGNEWKEACPLYADYEEGCYEGQSVVVFIHNGKLYFNYGSHCSCYGLESCWEPEEITLTELKHYLDDSYYFSRDVSHLNDFIELIDVHNKDLAEVEFLFRLSA